MFLIEASGGDIVYRSRACVQLIPSLFGTGKCDSCIGLLENIKHLEPGEKMEEDNVRVEFTCQNMECDIGDIPDQDETRKDKEEDLQVIKFKRKIPVKGRRAPTIQVVKSLIACSSNEHLDP